MNTKKESMFVTADGRNVMFTFALVSSLFLLWGFCNGMIDVMDKHFQEELHLTLSQSAWVQFAHYLGYFLMSMPAGWLATRLGYKGGIIAGLLMVAVGGFWFIPATKIAEFWAFLLGVCVIASGLTFLETVANPYTTVLGPPRYAATRINLAQSCNGIGWILGPIAGGMFFYGTDAAGLSTGAETLWIPYAGVAVVVLVLAVVFFFAPVPDIKTEDDYHIGEKDETDEVSAKADRQVARVPVYFLLWFNTVVLVGVFGMILWLDPQHCSMSGTASGGRRILDSSSVEHDRSPRTIRCSWCLLPPAVWCPSSLAVVLIPVTSQDVAPQHLVAPAFFGSHAGAVLLCRRPGGHFQLRDQLHGLGGAAAAGLVAAACGQHDGRAGKEMAGHRRSEGEGVVDRSQDANRQERHQGSAGPGRETEAEVRCRVGVHQQSSCPSETVRRMAEYDAAASDPTRCDFTLGPGPGRPVSRKTALGQEEEAVALRRSAVQRHSACRRGRDNCSPRIRKGVDRRRLNRMLLADAYPEELPFQDGILCFSNRAASFLATLGFICFLTGRFTGAGLLRKVLRPQDRRPLRNAQCPDVPAGLLASWAGCPSCACS